MPHIDTADLTPSQFRDHMKEAEDRRRLNSSGRFEAIKPVAKGHYRETPVEMRALQQQQQINLEAVKTITEVQASVSALQSQLREHREDTQQQSQRQEAQIRDLREEIAKSNVLLSRIAEQAETGSTIAREMWEMAKKILIGAGIAAGAGGASWGLFG